MSCSLLRYPNFCIDTQANADRAAKMVKIQYTSKGKPILTIADAIKNNSFYDFPGKDSILTVGNANGLCVCAYVHVYMCAYVRAYVHACVRACDCACMHGCVCVQ